MSRIKERKIIIILDKSQISNLEDYINNIVESNEFDISRIIDSQNNTRVSLKFRLRELLTKYSSHYIETAKHIDLTKDNNVILDYCILWVRDVNHLFKNHIEVEIYVLIDQYIQLDLDYQTFSKEIGEFVRAKLIYEIIDFEHYDLYWHNMKEQRIRISNIETLENENVIIEAVNLMKENVAAHNKV